MKYVFEDDERDPIPKLFMYAYPPSVNKNFIYTHGNGNIYTTVNELTKLKEIIIVYLDTIPGNDSTRRIYNKLLKLSKINSYTVIVLPIIGAEYYFIKSIQHENIVKSPPDIDTCVNRQPYFNSQLLSGQKEQEYCKTYERYCKLILMKAVTDCVRNSEDNGNNIYFRWYYEKNCKCEKYLLNCKDKSLIEKSKSLLAEYPYIPSGSSITQNNNIHLNTLWDIHRELVNEHNTLCDKLQQAEPDSDKKNLYKKIQTMK